MTEPSATDSAREVIDTAASRLPPALRRRVDRILSRWPGRLMTRTASSFIRIELFDRAMTIAAQFFTSVFPILIMMATWFGPSSTELARATGLPAETQSVLDEALNSSSTTTFGIVGVLIVLASATSLSRALTRAFSAIWQLPRPKTRLASAWRWLAAILALAMALVLTSAVTMRLGEEPPRGLIPLAVSLLIDVALGVFVPWVLLSGQVPPRHLAAGAALFAVVMMFLRPATSAWLPRALEVSADRYGSIGVAFTYLAFLYVLAFCWLVTAVVGQVVTTDEGWFGRRLRGQAAVIPLRSAGP